MTVMDLLIITEINSKLSPAKQKEFNHFIKHVTIEEIETFNALTSREDKEKFVEDLKKKHETLSQHREI